VQSSAREQKGVLDRDVADATRRRAMATSS
jgi:hypothetical protein